MMGFITLHPGFEESPTASKAAPRLSSLEGRVVGLLDNNKNTATAFLQYVDLSLRANYKVADVLYFRKENMSAPAPAELISQFRQCDALITAIGD